MIPRGHAEAPGPAPAHDPLEATHTHAATLERLLLPCVAVGPAAVGCLLITQGLTGTGWRPIVLGAVIVAVNLTLMGLLAAGPRARRPGHPDSTGRP